MDRTIPRLTTPDDRPGLALGDRADIVLIDGETITSAVMDRGTDRTVIHEGRLVADGLAVLPRTSRNGAGGLQVMPA